MTISDTELNDLTRLTIKRCRQQVFLSVQLLDGDDEQAAAMMTSIAVDLIEGAIIAMIGGTRDPGERDEAVRFILQNINRCMMTRQRTTRDEMS